MNTTTRILTAFAVATAAGVVLGMLLKVSECSKPRKIADEGKKQSGAYFGRFFGSKDKEPARDIIAHAEQNY